MSPPTRRIGAPHPPRESAAQRQARLRSLSALQRDELVAHWQRLSPTLSRIDLALARLRRLRAHPVALALLAVSASGLIASRRGRRLLGLARTSWRFGLRAATAFSLWRAVRPPAGWTAAQPVGDAGRGNRGEGARDDLRDAAAPRVSAGAR